MPSPQAADPVRALSGRSFLDPANKRSRGVIRFRIEFLQQVNPAARAKATDARAFTGSPDLPPDPARAYCAEGVSLPFDHGAIWRGFRVANATAARTRRAAFLVRCLEDAAAIRESFPSSPLTVRELPPETDAGLPLFRILVVNGARQFIGMLHAIDVQDAGQGIEILRRIAPLEDRQPVPYGVIHALF